MLQLKAHRFATALAENAAKQVGITALIKRAIGRRDSGGIRWNDRPIDQNLQHILAGADIVTRHVDVGGKVGIEIGPGDNLGTAYRLLAVGAAKMYAVEKFASVADEWNRKLFAHLGDADTSHLQHVRALFEDLNPADPVDFIYSLDVLEHVDPVPVFRHAFRLLKPGGDFVHAVDFTGHNCFHDPKRPLDFLTCPDWMWKVLFSAMETTNRIRWSQLLRLASHSGFEIVRAHVVRRADAAYLASIRPHLLPRYQQLSDDDLSVMQCELHLRKAATDARPH